MDTLIGSLVFLLPGFLAYFWLQSFGLNPTVKHTPAEMGAVASLLWFPVSMFTILINNVISGLLGRPNLLQIVWSMADLKQASNSFAFLSVFLLVSSLSSLVICFVWVKWGYPFQLKITNKVRVHRGIAPYSNASSVWDDVFSNNDAQVIQIGKIDKMSEDDLIGNIRKASRPFESERNLALEDVQYFTDLVKKYQIPVAQVFLDTKSGTYIKIFDPQAILDAQLPDSNTTSSSEVAATES